ncbi:MAG: ubiquinol-cytochrome c reductase iron-sulfur subunit [Acidobacteria bacterium]|nr:ubiquinol-cytochrome c reductase iron-sulfur subunit [Acidobacteriota bacterium]
MDDGASSHGVDVATSRRRFLEWCVVAMTTVISVATSVPVLGYLLSPLRRPGREDAWISLGPLSLVPDGRPVEVPYLTEVVDGWIRETVVRRAIVLRSDSDVPTVFSGTCPHLNCNVRWVDQEGRFVCPCHGGVFDRDGRVVAGPPPRGLDRLDARVENGVLLVREV